MIRISIDGMSCAHCVRHVQEALTGLPGVAEVEVSLADKLATVRTTAEVSDPSIREALDEAGYTATAIERG